MPETKAGFLHWNDKKWFRWVTWGMLLYAVTGIWIHLMFVLSLVSTTRLCLIPLSILHTGQIWPFPLFVSLFDNLYHSNFHPNNSCWPPLSNQKRPLTLTPLSLSLSLFLTLYLSLLSANNVCVRITVISGKFCIATEQNNYIFIYVQWKWMHTPYIFMKQTFKTFTLDTKTIFIYFCVTGTVSKTTS